MASELPPDLRAFLDALYTALADPAAPAVARDRSVVDALLDLTSAALPIAAQDNAAANLIDALSETADHPILNEALEAATRRFGTPEAFGEAIGFARWLGSTPDVPTLVELRRYVERAILPPSLADLVVDAGALLLSTNLQRVWRSNRLADAIGTLSQWRTRYVIAYTRGHTLHSREVSAVVDAVEDTAPRAVAVERLNGLRRLGAAVALTALGQYRELERQFACSIAPERLAEALLTQTTCPECGYLLGDRAPVADTRRVRQAIERGLLTQQRRLAQRVVSRLLAAPAQSEVERLSRFVQVVQASDLAGLALVLDDTLIEFLRDFLEPQPAPPNLIDRLATSFPEVTLANIDGVVAELRRLLTSDVVAAGGRLRLSQASQDI